MAVASSVILQAHARPRPRHAAAATPVRLFRRVVRRGAQAPDAAESLDAAVARHALCGPSYPVWREVADAASGILRRGAHDGPCSQSPCYLHMAAYHERARRLRTALAAVEGPAS